MEPNSDEDEDGGEEYIKSLGLCEYCGKGACECGRHAADQEAKCLNS